MDDSQTSGWKLNAQSDAQSQQIAGRIDHAINSLRNFYSLMGNAPEETGSLGSMAVILCEAATDEQIQKSLNRCMRECRYPVRIPDILQRIPGSGTDDGRPGAETAWGMCPKTEDQSVVWTDEMSEAFGAGARQLLRDGDPIAARMAFREMYARCVERARREGTRIHWTVSLGWDRADRVRALTEGVTRKLITAEAAANLLGPDEREQLFMALPASTSTKLLPVGETRSILPTLPGFAGLLQQMRIDGQVPTGCDPGPPRPQSRPMCRAEIDARRELLRKQAGMLTKRSPVAGAGGEREREQTEPGDEAF